MKISKEFRFEASHVLPNHSGKCSRVHGHSWRLVVTVEGLVSPVTGFVMDFYDLKKVVDSEIIDKVDHHHLGAGDLRRSWPWHKDGAPQSDKVDEAVFGPAFYPTSENLVVVFAADILVPALKKIGDGHVFLTRLELNETCTSAAIWEK